MQERGSTLFLLMLAIACLITAALTMNWWSKSAGYGQARLGLRDAEVCIQEVCSDVDISESPLARSHRPNLLYGTFVALLAIAALLSLQAIASFARGEPYLAGWMAILCAVGLALSFATGFVGGIMNVSYSFLLALTGNVVATIVLVQSLGARRAALEAQHQMLLRTARAAHPAQRSPAAAALSDRLAPSSAQGDDPLASAVIKKKSTLATGEHSLLARADALGGAALRFSVRDAVIGDTNIRTVDTEGEQRTVELTNVQALYVRMLPQDGPAARTVFLDIVPRPDAGGHVVPHRFVPTTRANYAVLPGGAAVASQENFRRLAARILALSPHATLDDDTRAFVKDNRAPRQLMALDHFADYDARYA